MSKQRHIQHVCTHANSHNQFWETEWVKNNNKNKTYHDTIQIWNIFLVDNKTKTHQGGRDLFFSNVVVVIFVYDHLAFVYTLQDKLNNNNNQLWRLK